MYAPSPLSDPDRGAGNEFLDVHELSAYTTSSGFGILDTFYISATSARSGILGILGNLGTLGISGTLGNLGIFERC
jgi:hypothetical protein